jgi:hypothetical protein
MVYSDIFLKLSLNFESMFEALNNFN